MKPIIGIIEWPYKDLDGDKIYEVLTPIIECIVRNGGRPIGIFPTQIEDYIEKRLSDIREMTNLEQKDLEESIDMCDAIIKPGATKIYNHERKIYKYALKKDIPYLGICAGMQIMASNNFYNIKNEKNDGFINHHSDEDYAHRVYIEENTKLYEILKQDHILVNSRHNYHVKDTDMLVSAVSEDGIIEAIENPSCSFHLGLQWHPELLPTYDENTDLIFDRFIEEAKVYSKKRK